MATAIATAMATATAMAAQHKEINFFNVYKLTGSCMVSGVYSNTFIFTSTQDTKQLYENFASSSPMKKWKPEKKINWFTSGDVSKFIRDENISLVFLFHLRCLPPLSPPQNVP